MEKTVGSLSLMTAAIMLMSVSPVPRERFSAELLARLDPAVTARSLCGGKEGTGRPMRAMLSVAATVVQGQTAMRAPLYDNLGKVHLPITTSHPLAQRFFDQGLALAYGFNHAGAIASFREAQRLDPNCAMCFWGEALAHGPNINAPMNPATNARAVGLAGYAQWLARNGSLAEQLLTAAMIKRYSADPKADRAELDTAYADAMLAAAEAQPAHDDIALLAVEAAMDTRPWDYWLADRRTPQPRLREAVRLVETVLARNPDHPQAPHLYIHLMENGPDPKRAEAAADRLATPLAAKAAHLLHMPAHIYYRLGRWQDSLRVNIAAARADEEWIRSSGDRGLVRYGYYPHNVHFIVTSAQMAGDMATAMREAQRLETILDAATSAKIAWVQAIHAAPYFAAAQFATPNQVLGLRAPDARLPYAVAMRHYARASAYAQQRNRRGFDQELAMLSALRDSEAMQPMIDQGVPARDLLQLAETVALARWEQAGGRYREAEKHYRAAVAIEEKIPYMEPPYWYYPVQQSLGGVLYRQARHEEALAAFTGALARSPNNGWVLYGIASSQRALGRRAHAAAAQAAFKRVWAGESSWLRMDRL
ncbi:Tetratricopeptide TPR_2 repeat protein [Sphingobium herbicidovorans NBRC 16415]|uniref:Tetratricopeptide TPR_2 repeat protein n=1 Tax=Sphingobium herbicidovorans (strain ATCC 700291 / DSM 11019 / CCUG 56400 / KCTC 2939 / LMG 18315 / NBRC 16415 / MH) TaxID=1219045 RepID=A0A086PBU5_SPHHM|nr:tetratricopeptide repeat protein [Sphingobium herbicidovorans]KFG90863.1 Tetratricopeptide TPR_2 repeat protein [Sphingobium herbicidovorans NBRC 16415]